MSMCDEKSFCCFVRHSAAEIVRVAYELLQNACVRESSRQPDSGKLFTGGARQARACSAEWRAAAVSTSQTAVGTVHRQRHATRRTLRLAAVVRCRAGRRVPSRRTPHAGARARSARVAWWHGRHGTRWITRRSLRSLAAACRGRYVVTLIVRLQRVSSGNRPRSGPLAFADLPACLE